MNTGLAPYRKFIAFAVMGLIMLVLKHAGLTPDELIVWGTSVSDIQEAVVDYLITIGIPAVFGLAQPNERGESLWQYWRWLAASVAVIVALVLGVSLF